MNVRPTRDEAAEYYFTYIDQVPDGNIRDLLDAQLAEAAAALTAIPDARSNQRYADNKWTIKEVVSHINDTERVFAFRALWFGRGFTEPLASFDQLVAIAGAGAAVRSWSSHVDDFRAVRASTLSLFRHMPAEAWGRRGVASGREVSVRALAYIIAGHCTHHLRILRERYLQ